MPTIGIFLALLVVMYLVRWVYSKACLQNLDVQLYMSANTATEGDIVTLTEVLTNSKWLPLPWVSVKFRTGRELKFTTSPIASDAYYRNDLFHILMHQKITRRLPFECAKRGYYAIDGLELTGWDVLMENKYIRQFPCDIRLTVLPRTIATPEVDHLCSLVYGQLRTRHPINPDPFSFRGIREYYPSDPVKTINFKASAKAQNLMVNVWDFSNARRVAILLDTERHTVWHNETLEERAIKIAASVAEKMVAIGTPISFTTNGRSVISGNATNIYEGYGAQQLHTILEALAYIDLANQAIAPITNNIEDILLEGHHDPEYWLISAYYSAKVEEAYHELKHAGVRVVWIMPDPRPQGTDICDQIIFV